MAVETQTQSRSAALETATLAAGGSEATARRTVGDVTVPNPVMSCRHVDVYYGDKHAIRDVSLDVAHNEVVAMIGPSGCGKSTLLRCLNRLNDTIPSAVVKGTITLDGQDIYDKRQDVVQLRARVGMVFQKPNPFPKSVFENVAYGPRIHGLAADRTELDEIVQTSLQRAGLWEEVKDKIQKSAYELSGGQQQRLCIARTIAIQPEIILMDEPASALDPISTLRIEELMQELKKNYTIIIVTHNMQQAARVSDYTAMMMLEKDGSRSGTMIEFSETKKIFTNPKDKRTEDYVTGRFG